MKKIYLVAFLIYCAMLPRFFIGQFRDDAVFILLAKSMLHGSFANLSEPGQPLFGYTFPGYPMFLVPFVKLVQPHWTLLKLTSLIQAMGSCVIASALYKRWLPERFAWGASALFCLNPVLAMYSGAVMSDVSLMFSILIGTLLLVRESDSPSTRSILPLGLALTWVAMIRPTGAFFVVAVIGVLGLQRKYLKAGAVIAVFVPIYVAWLIRNMLTFKTSTLYMPYFYQQIENVIKNPATLPHQFFHSAKNIILYSFLNWPIPTRGTWNLPALLVILGVGVCSFAGYRYLSRTSQQSQVVRGLALYTLLMLGLLFVWTGFDPRYTLPILPFLVLFTVAGVAAVYQEARWRPWMTGIALLSVGAYANATIQILHETYSKTRPGHTKHPSETLRWIQEHTDPSSLFLNDSAAVYLYTQRQGYEGIAAQSYDEFVRGIRSRHIAYIALSPSRILSVKGTGFVDHATIMEQTGQWIVGHPERFKLVYLNNKEERAIFAVMP